MATYIISDLHLSSHQTLLLKGFSHFVSSLQKNDKLYILGDLFNFFVGVDKSSITHKTVSSVCKKAFLKGVRIYFQRGNRDFLISQADCDYFGFRLIPDLFVIYTGAGSVLLMHGDLLCTNDKKYQRYRAKVHKSSYQKLFFKLPLCIRLKIGRAFRNKSINARASRSNKSIYGIVPSTVDHFLRQSNAKSLIHGHIHVLEKQSLAPNHKMRICLGAWGASYSYIKADANGLSIIEKPIDKLFESSYL